MALAILQVVITPINEVGMCLFRAIKRGIIYFIKYNANLENLQNKVSQLKARKEDVQKLADEAKMELKEPSKEVQDWLQGAAKMEEGMKSLDEKLNANNRCLKGLCPDPYKRLRLSKQVVKKMVDVHDLYEQGNFTVVAHVLPPPKVELVRTSSIIKTIPSRNLDMKILMEALHDDMIRSIGVHGMGGIGKTTLVNEVNNELHGSNLFKKVIVVTVSKDPDLKIIQDHIAERLGLNLEQSSSTVVRANKLFLRLKAEETVLIILDDVWKKLEVMEIGIPRDSEHMGCKIIVTTRYHEVCNQMNLQKIIKMDPLNGGESWDLFKAKVGYVATFPNLQPIAQQIVGRCKGSPLAIGTLGSTLKAVEDESEWNDALWVLRNPDRSGLEGIMPEVIKSLRISYDHLRTPEVKLCFLYCCLFPEDYSIDLFELRNYGIGEGFLNVSGTLDDVSNRLFSFIKQLKDCGLLLEGDKEGSVKMHDVVRDVAISIASDEENGFLVNLGCGFKNLREEEKLKGYKRISFMKNNKMVFSDPLECPQLRSLLIRENIETSIDEETFFEGAKSLVVLDLRGSAQSIWGHSVISPPKSLSCLTNLRTLHVVDCDVSKNVSVLGGLRKLEVLSLRHSIVKRLPEEIGNLTSLMCLDLTKAELSIVAPNVISRLSNLEELYMWNNYMAWDEEGRSGELNASLVEVAALTRLVILKINIRAKTPHDMFYSWKKLKTFSISVHGECIGETWLYNTVEFREVNPLEHWVNKLLSISSKMHLSLFNCHAIENVVDLASVGEGLKHLEKLRAMNCNDIEHLIGIDQSNKDSQDSFGTLQMIELDKMERMKKIFHGPTPSTTFFGQLRIVQVSGCHQIKNIFSSNLLLAVKRLDNLEEVKVRYCDELEEVFNTEEEVVGGIVEAEPETINAPRTPTVTTPMIQLSRSMLLYLDSLPKMMSIWKGVVPIGSLRHLKKVTLMNCHGLEYFSSYSTVIALQSVETLSIFYCNGMKRLVLSNGEEEGEATSYSSKLKKTLPPPTFPNLLVLKIELCDNLKRLFSFSVARDLQQLNTLQVFSCENLKEIIGKEEEEEEGGVDHRCFLPQLQSLCLLRLRSLTSIVQGNVPISSPNLKQIRVLFCPNLKKLPLEPQVASSLQVIIAESDWFQGLEWEDESIQSRFGPLFEEYTGPLQGV